MTTRRSLLARAVAVIASFIGGAVAVPVIGAIVSPSVREVPSPRIDLGVVDEFAVREPRKVDFFFYKEDGWIQQRTAGSTWVVRWDDTSFSAYVLQCTHLGCPYGWNADRELFICPCHDGLFSIDGQVVGGPPPRPLDRYVHAIEGDRLIIELEVVHA